MLLCIEAKVAVVVLDGLFTNAIKTFPFPLPGLRGRVAAAYELIISIPQAALLPAFQQDRDDRLYTVWGVGLAVICSWDFSLFVLNKGNL